MLERERRPEIGDFSVPKNKVNADKIQADTEKAPVTVNLPTLKTNQGACIFLGMFNDIGKFVD